MGKLVRTKILGKREVNEDRLCYASGNTAFLIFRDNFSATGERPLSLLNIDINLFNHIGQFSQFGQFSQ
jgi:hypothetical protein